VLSRFISQETLYRYAEASGDFNPIHLDAAFAATTPFGRPIAHGMLLLAYLVEMLTAAFGEAWIRSGHIKVSFRKPALVNTSVTTWGTVKSYQQETGLLQVSVGCRGEDGADLVTGDARLHMLR